MNGFDIANCNDFYVDNIRARNTYIYNRSDIHMDNHSIHCVKGISVKDVYSYDGFILTSYYSTSDILTAINYRASLFKEIGSCFTEPTCLFLKEKTAVDFSTGLISGMSCPSFKIFLAAFMSLS